MPSHTTAPRSDPVPGLAQEASWVQEGVMGPGSGVQSAKSGRLGVDTHDRIGQGARWHEISTCPRPESMFG